jgi:ABC-type phosphate/phosphonate transport system substrate-binding protein
MRSRLVCALSWQKSLLALVLLLFVGIVLPAGEAIRPAAALHIGLSGTITQDVPDALVRASSRPMLALIETHTRRKSEFSIAADADQLADRLACGQTALGVFPGWEFAWVRQKHPRLAPVLIAVNHRPQLHAVVIVRHDSPAQQFSDLAGQTVARLRVDRGHCRLFYERHCNSCGAAPETFFGRIATPNTAEEALDEVVDGTASVAIVDATAWECYQRHKPGRSAPLKELLKSEAFPATVIAYLPGAVDETLLRRFREGLLGAKQTTAGRQALLLWRITGFEAVPKDYEQTLANIAKAYPRPASKEK